MRSKINQLLEEIDNKKKELLEEYHKLLDKYSFEFKNWKIVFAKDKKASDKKKKKSIWNSISTTTLRDFLSIPFIYSMIIPVVFFDIFLFIYQQTAMRLYWIPLVKRRDHITYDRKELAYLNAPQKFNCLYCSYVNGFLSYASEIAGRTEKYWCPIKHAKKMRWEHYRHKYFADYWDNAWFFEVKGSVAEYHEDEKQSKKWSK